VTAARLAGTELARALREDVAARAADLRAAGTPVRVAIVVATDDGGSAWYVRSIVKACEKAGIEAGVTDLGPAATGGEIATTLQKLSADGSVSGIILQTPLPPGVGLSAMAENVDVAKDIDGVNPLSLGRLTAGVEAFAPATAEAVVRLIEHHGIELAGRDAVIVGRSLVVGKPLAQLLLERNATVTVAHSRTRDLAQVTQRAEVLVAAVGRTHLIGPGHVSAGTNVIDVGTNPTEDGGLAGDVSPDVAEVAAGLSPVPGGVGPVTTALLLTHAVQAAERAR